MSKYSFSTLFILSGLFSISAQAELGELAQKYTWGEYYFDGAKAKNDRGSALNIDNKKKLVEGSLKGGGTYRMNWATEEIENSKVLTVTEVRVTPMGKDKSDVYSRTSTFSGDYLRSTTTCFGDSKAGSLGSTQNEMKCITATKRACKRLMDAYNSKTGMGAMSMQDTAKAAQHCSSVLKGYEAMAAAFGNQSVQMEGRHNDVIDGDMDRVKSLVDQTTGSKAWDPTNIGSKTKSSELDAMAKDYAASIQGMRALTTAIQICNESLGDFADGAVVSGATRPGTSANGNKAAH